MRPLPLPREEAERGALEPREELELERELLVEGERLLVLRLDELLELVDLEAITSSLLFPSQSLGLKDIVLSM